MDENDEEPIIFNCKTFYSIIVALLIVLGNVIALYFYNHNINERSSQQL